MKQHLLKPFAMLLCLVMASLTTTAQAQTRGGGEDEGISLEFQISAESQILNTGLSHVWSYPVEIPSAPYWVSYNSDDANKFETLCLRIERNPSAASREGHFTMVAYFPVEDSDGHHREDRKFYTVHILQDGAR